MPVVILDSLSAGTAIVRDFSAVTVTDRGIHTFTQTGYLGNASVGWAIVASRQCASSVPYFDTAFLPPSATGTVALVRSVWRK